MNRFELGGHYHHVVADLLFDWIGFDQRSSFNISKATESKQNKLEVSRTVILPLV